MVRAYLVDDEEKALDNLGKVLCEFVENVKVAEILQLTHSCLHRYHVTNS